MSLEGGLRPHGGTDPGGHRFAAGVALSRPMVTGPHGLQFPGESATHGGPPARPT